MEPIELLILDCDGVLIRSEAANLAYYNKIFSYFQLPVVTDAQPEKKHILHTHSTPQVITHFFEGEMRKAATDYAATLEYLEFAQLVEVEPGWSETLEMMRPNTAICVATNRGKSANEVLKVVGLDRFMEKVITIHHVQNPKPAPDMLLLALSSFGLAPEKAAYVGDSELDRQAAKAAGIKFIGFRTDGELRIDSPAGLEYLRTSGKI